MCFECGQRGHYGYDCVNRMEKIRRGEYKDVSLSPFVIFVTIVTCQQLSTNHFRTRKAADRQPMKIIHHHNRPRDQLFDTEIIQGQDHEVEVRFLREKSPISKNRRPKISRKWSQLKKE